MSEVTVTNILSDPEGVKALDFDSDSADADQVNAYIAEASYFIYRRTGKDWGTSNKLAKQCCSLVMAKDYYKDDEHDFTKPIEALLADLIDVVREEASANA